MDLRAQIRAALESAAAIAQKAVTEKRGISDAENAEIAVFEKRAADLKAQLATEERAAALAAEAGKFATVPAHQAAPRSGEQPDGQQQPTPEERANAERETAEETARILTFESDERKYQAGDALGALMFARVKFGNDQRAAQEWSRRQYGERSRQHRAMQASNFSAGGATIAENFVGAELIELLRAKAAVRRAGARSIPLVGGTATIPKITGGATGYWVDEGDNGLPGDMSTGNVKLAEKKMICLVPFSNDLFRNSSLMTDRLIRDDMVRATANTEDLAFLRGSGSANAPKGIYYWVGSSGRSNSAGTSLANIRTDIRTAKNRLGNANAPDERRAWFMHSRGINYIGTEVVDANSNLVWPALANGDGAQWNGGIVYQDNNIPITLGSGDKSEVYYVEMSECFIGDSGVLEIEVFANASYAADASNTIRSGVSRDESVIRLIRKVDFAMRHTESGYVLESVSYGA